MVGWALPLTASICWSARASGSIITPYTTTSPTICCITLQSLLQG